MGDHGIKWWGDHVDLDYAGDLSILDESVSKMNELLDFLWVQGARISPKYTLRRLSRLGISEDEKLTLGNEKIDQMISFTYLGFINIKDNGSSKDVKSRKAKAQVVFSQ